MTTAACAIFQPSMWSRPCSTSSAKRRRAPVNACMLARGGDDHYQGHEPEGAFLNQDLIAAHLKQSLEALERANGKARMLAAAQKTSAAIIAALRSGNKLLVIGNGGSAGDAQHIAAEITCRLNNDRHAHARDTRT